MQTEKDAPQMTEKYRQLEAQVQQLTEERDQLKQEKDQLHQQLQEKNTELNNKIGHINLLLESDRELQRIHQSKVWRLVSAGRRVKAFIAPPNSKRWLVLKLTKKVIRHPILCLKKVDRDHIKKFADGVKTGSIASTSQRLDNYLGGGMVTGERPEQLPATEYESIEAVPPLHVPVSEKPLVSIIIPVYNQFAYTYACLKSIAKNSGDVSFEVLVADDCSTDATKDMTKAISGVRVIRNKKNLRFLLNCNHAAKKAKGKYILFLNNDTQVMENWLQPLVTLIESSEKIGMVGSKLIYPDGRLQEAGGIMWKDASAWNYGHLQDPAMPEFNYVKEADYISGAAIMIRADLWKKLGGFDERFVPAYCEDSDLAFQVRAHGYKVLYQPQSVVIHFEGVSNGTDTSSGQKAYQVENQKKFYEKWKDVLEAEHNPNGVNPFLAKDRSLHKKTLLFVDHYVPQYDKDAGSRTVFAYIKMFASSGFNVKFIGDNFFPHQPYTTVLQQMGVEVLYGNWYGQHWKEWLTENAGSFDYAFLNRPHIAVNYIDLLREKSKAHILYYGHDLHFLRMRREYEVTGDPKLLKDAEEWKEKELSLMRKSDLAAYPSQVEIDEIHKMDPSIQAVAITPYFYDEMPDVDYRISNRKDLFFIGGYTHGPNVDAVKWIAAEIMPLLRKKIPGIAIHIAGSNMPQELIDLGCEDIIMEGQLTDEQLSSFYTRSRINLIPLRYGAGIKGKVVESLLHGLPVVTTACGAEGIVDAENVLTTAETAKEIAQKIADLYHDEKKLKKISRDGIQYVRDHYTEKEAKRILNDVYHFF